MSSKNIFVVAMLMSLAFTPGCAKKEMLKTTPETSPVAGTSSKQGEAATGNAAVSQEPIKESAIREEKPAGPVESTGRDEIRQSLEVVYFDFDSHVLAPAAREALYKNFRWLSANPRATVQIEGHCDERGSGEYNLALGEKRAKTAMQYLLNLGIASDRLSSVSYGEEKPAVTGHDEDAWQKNRRAEFVISNGP